MKRKDAMKIAGTFGLLAMVATGCGIDRVSVSADGSRANGTESYAHPAIDGAGDVVAFESNATNLVPLDTNGFKDIFVRHPAYTMGPCRCEPPETERATISSTGAEANGDSSWPSIDDGGGAVVFESTASNLVDGDTNGVSDVFVHYRWGPLAHQTVRVSVATDGSELTPGTYNFGSRRPVISADGRYVAFLSDATNTGNGLDASAVGLYLRDLQKSTTTFIGLVGENTAQNVIVPDRPAISSDGNVVAYTQSMDASKALTGRTDVSVVDRAAGTSEFVTSKDDPTLASSLPSVSGDGRFVSFAQKSNYGGFAIWVLDRLNHSYSDAADVSPAGAPVLSADGRYLAFSAKARRTAYGPNSQYAYWFATDQAEMYRVDRETGAVKWISAHLDNGANKLASSQSPAIDNDGKEIAFTSTTYNFGGGVTNPISDVFTWTDKQ